MHILVTHQERGSLASGPVVIMDTFTSSAISLGEEEEEIISSTASSSCFEFSDWNPRREKYGQGAAHFVVLAQGSVWQKHEICSLPILMSCGTKSGFFPDVYLHQARPYTLLTRLWLVREDVE